MDAVDWDSVPLAEPPPGAVEVPVSGFGFLAVACILELGVPNVVYRLPRETGPAGSTESGERSREVAACLAEADISCPADPLADCWFIVPAPSMPTEGFWDALREAEPLRQAAAGPGKIRDGMRVAMQVLYSNS